MESHLRVPGRLNKVLSRSQNLHGVINLTLADFGVWLADNKMVFFSEYTDHGPTHISEVLVTAEALIRDEAWSALTPEDSAIIVLSIVLHDSAMHLSEDGFVEILSSNLDSEKKFRFKREPPWSLLWEEFLGEASRFDGRTLIKLFGEATPCHRPPSKPLDWTLKDRLLIGEFIRRHHARLAYEIALHGVPGGGKKRLGLVHIEERFAELAGFVARSHGLSLRYAVDLLQREERREVHNVHVPFLMTVLRIADYLQIQQERAPKQVLQVRTLRSPISSQEWRAHHAIDYITCVHDDPEALYVKTEPKNVSDYLKIKSLLSSIQLEFDEVWAVLGEVYGRVEGLKQFGLTVRRIRSNIDDESKFWEL